MSIDWNSIQQETITHLQNLLRINTTNPPGNEIAAVTYLAEILKKEGIPFQIFEPSPGRANLVARLKGSGEKKPLLLTAHLDVVPAEAAQWSHSPFSGDLADGCLWGRGAVDMKQMAVMELMMLLLAKRQGISLSRDIIFAAVADEEAGCEWGSKWLVENKKELLDAEYALNEVGGFSLYVDGAGEKIFYPIGVAERGVCWLTLKAKGNPGHGSMPHAHQAVVKLSQAAHQLGTKDFPFHSHPVTRDFISTLASYQGGIRKLILKFLLIPGLNSFILKYLIPADKSYKFKPLFRNTVSPTILHAGDKVNVIPSTAEMKIDGRILPGQTIELFLRELEKIMGVELEQEINCAHEPTTSSYPNEFYRHLTQTLIRHDPQAVPVPYLIPGFTDSAHYRKLGIKCYGFVPLKLPRDMNFSEMFHGHNERVPVEGLMFGVKVLWDVMMGM